MKNLKSLLAGFVLAAGLAFAPVTVLAAEDTENVLPAMETVEETVEVANEEVVFSIPTVETAEGTTTETTETVKEAVEATEEATDETVEATADTTEVVAGDVETPAPAVEEEIEEADADSTTDTTVEEVTDAASTADTTEVPAVEEIVAGDVETPAPAIEEVEETVEETANTTVDETVAPVAGVDATATEEVADVASADDTTNNASEEAVTGHQVGTANNGYAEMSDGSDAFCVEQEKDHIEEDVEYTREDDVDGSNFNNIFAARQEALEEQNLSSEDINKITQLAIWAVLSGESYEDLVNFYYHESGVDLYNKMFQAHEGDWTFKYWGYTPSNDMFQKLIAGQASKVTTPVEPEQPEEPSEPEEPEVPEQPETPETPDVPETPDTPDEPTVPDTPAPETPSEPSVPETPVEDTVVPQEPVVLSQVFEAPVAPSVPVLSARMASTGDNSNTAARMAVIFAMAAVVALLTKKENI